MDTMRVAVVQTVMAPGGGTEACTAWAIEALKHDYEVTLITYSEVDADLLNRYYGTGLRDDDFSFLSPSLFWWLNRTKRFSMLKGHLMMRYCKSARQKFDLFINIGAGVDFGSVCIQYIALAAASTLAKVLSSDSNLPRWYRLAQRSSLRLSESVSGFSDKAAANNITLVESHWTGAVVQRIYGVPSYDVVYPPVNALSFKPPWEGRQEGFLCIARIAPGKLIHEAIDILKRVRERGYDVTLRIVGRSDDPDYFDRIKALAEENSSWVSVDGFIPRSDLVALMGQYKYGINAASDEPFGIAVAEMLNAGSIVFVSNGGGQIEIVNTPQLIYDNIDDAVEKITRVLREEPLQKTLLGSLSHQSSCFSTQAYCDGIKTAVDKFFGQPAVS